MLPWIWTQLRDLSFSSVLDVFGGSASMSYLFKKMGKQVTYNDYLKFNHHVGLALIENDRVKLNQEDIDLCCSLNSRGANRFISDTFQGIYFTDKENEWIDNAVAKINAINDRQSFLKYKKALLFYSLFQSCLSKRPFNLFHRRNLYFRFATVKRTFHNKKTWDKPFREHFENFSLEANEAVFEGLRPCRAICYDALDIPENDFELVYLDPPYLTKGSHNESSDYLRCYHFLEGLCDYHHWNELIDYSSTNLRMKNLRENVWTQPDQHGKAFDALLENFANSIIVVSYKRYGVPSVDTLIRMFKRHGRKVRIRSRHYTYALNHQNGDAKANREVLLISE